MEAEKIAFAELNGETVRKLADGSLLNEHRHAHGLAELGQADCRELRRVHRVLAAEMARREMEHDSPLECAEKALALRAPHGFLAWKGKKTAVAGPDPLPVGEPLMVVTEGEPFSEGFGMAVLAEGARMTADEFDRGEWSRRHLVRPEERRMWWPEAETLHVHRLESWEPFDEPVVVEVAGGRAAVKQYEPPTEREAELVERGAKLPKAIVLTPKAVSLTGSLLYGKHEARDADFVVVGAEWRADEDRFVVPLTATFKEKLERALAAVYEVDRDKIQFISEGQGATFDHLPLYQLALVRLPRLQVEHVSEGEPDFAALAYDKPGAKALSRSALDRKLRGASDEVKRQAKETHDKDEVKPGRMVLSLKPMRPAPSGERQVVSHFYEYIEKNLEFPLFLSAKRDGATHYVHGDGKRIWFFSDDGEDNTERLPTLAAAFKKRYEDKPFVFGCELEKWVGGDHYPREAAIGDVKKGEDGDLAANVFRVVYWDGEDLHKRPFSEIWKTMREIPADSRSDGKLRPREDGPVNVVPHYKVDNLAELRKRLASVAYKPGVEGVVVKRADGAFPLNGEPGSPPTAVKWHKSVSAVLKVTGKTETKTKGVWVYDIAVGDMEIGKTFGTKQAIPVGSSAEVETEQMNVERGEGGDVQRVSFWAPDLIGKSDEKPETLETIVARARKHGVLREKVRRDGEMEYLPNEPGDPATADKDREETWQSYADFIYIDDQGEEHPIAFKSPFWGVPSTKENAKRQDILLRYPDEGKKQRFVWQEHFRGRSAHGDFRAQCGDFLVGWTVPNQVAGAIKEPVETEAAARKALTQGGNWKMDLKTGLVRERRIRGGTVRRGELRAFPKATEVPASWLGVEGVTEEPEPGEEAPVGATAEFPGVFVIVDKGAVEFGAQMSDFHEYFIDGGKWGKQRWTFRLLERGKSEFPSTDATDLPECKAPT